MRGMNRTPPITQTTAKIGEGGGLRARWGEIAGEVG
jgi:hypothetical protein